MVSKKKNPLFVRRWDGKICPSATIVCGAFLCVFGLCFVMQYIVSFLVLQSSCCMRKRELVANYFVFLLSCGCLCSVAPRAA